MSDGYPWGVLEIEPTGDTRAIRRSYARLLKGIDVEADPRGFIELREAFEQAQMMAQWVDEEALDQAEPGEPQPVAAMPAPPLPATAALVERCAAMAELLFPGGVLRDEPLRETDKATFQEGFAALVAAPELEAISVQGEVEAWAAESLARGWPISEPLLPAVARHFGWADAPADVRTPRPIAFLKDRLEEKHVAPAITEPDRRVVGGFAPEIGRDDDRFDLDLPDLGARGPSWGPAGAPRPHADAPPEPERPQPWRTTDQQAEEHARALARLVQDHHPRGRFPTAEEDRAMLAHWRAILADARMQQIDFYGDMEGWFARLLSGTAPFTDVLVLPVTRHFGWLQREGHVRQSTLLDAITHRYRILEFLEAIQRPDNPHNEAFRELTTPVEPGSRRGKVSIKKVHRLLHQIRDYYPDLEGCLDTERVAMWKPPGELRAEIRPAAQERQVPPSRGPGGLSWWGWAAILFVSVLAFAVALGDKRPTSSPPRIETGPAMVADRDDDIREVLSNVGDGKLDWAEVQRRNKGLAQLLRSNWELARSERKELYPFLTDMHGLLNRRYSASIAVASYANIAEYHRIVVGKARALRELSIDRCDDFLRGGDVASALIPAELRARERALVSRVLLETREPPSGKGDGRFSYSGAIWEKGAKRAGLSKPVFSDALNGEATPGARCNAWIALFEVALELPRKEGLALMRDMS